MGLEENKEPLSPVITPGSLVKEHLPLLLGGLGIGLIILALTLNYINGTQSESVKVSGEKAPAFTGVQGQSFSRKIVKVDIEGAIERPGVYQIPNDSRIQDVLISAGGVTAKADRTYLSVNINLAQYVFDGQKIYIPETGENLPKTVISPTSQANSALININNASETDLDSLPGIGTVTADKIIAGRPYQTISQLLEKHLVSSSVFEKIKDKITVN